MSFIREGGERLGIYIEVGQRVEYQVERMGIRFEVEYGLYSVGKYFFSFRYFFIWSFFIQVSRILRIFY